MDKTQKKRARNRKEFTYPRNYDPSPMVEIKRRRRDARSKRLFVAQWLAFWTLSLGINLLP